MKSQVTTGIVLSRTDYGEADRVVTFLTPDVGKLRVMARGVRKIKSRMAAGIELFSVSEITFMLGRGELATLVSARLQRHYGNIIHHIDRVQLGYALIALLHRATEDQTEVGYFELLDDAFRALNDDAIALSVIDAWFQAQLLKLSGQRPNLQVKDAASTDQFNFDVESARFVPFPAGPYGANQVKVMRLLFADLTPEKLAKVAGMENQLQSVMPLVTMLRRSYLK